jgi:hypothetical protein
LLGSELKSMMAIASVEGRVSQDLESTLVALCRSKDTHTVTPIGIVRGGSPQLVRVRFPDIENPIGILYRGRSV